MCHLSLPSIMKVTGKTLTHIMLFLYVEMTRTRFLQTAITGMHMFHCTWVNMIFIEQPENIKVYITLS